MSKTKLHPRNKHQGYYIFDELVKVNPSLEQYTAHNPKEEKTINFHDPEAVKQLNKALLFSFYKLQYWDIPADNLCPPIPGRADYIHYIADLLREYHPASNKIPKGSNILGLDIGTGANLIYPIIGSQEYGWSFIGSDINERSLQSADQIISKNKTLHSKVFLRKQNNSDHIFKGIIQPEDFIDFTLCNPPFHSSKEEAIKGTQRKLRNLGQINSMIKLNFSGSSHELWCDGGELSFVKKMIAESVVYQKQCMWFTTLISKQSNLKPIQAHLKKANPTNIKVVEMGQGSKTSRFIAWSFFTPTQHKKWVAAKWK